MIEAMGRMRADSCRSLSQGISGEKPRARDLIATMKSHEMYVYCGHGSGEQYVPLPLMRRLDGQCPAALLVGCSSGRLRRPRASHYDPHGAVISYLMSGGRGCCCWWGLVYGDDASPL